MSAEIQESLSNFRVIVAFNRLDYFRKKFDAANEQTYAASVEAGLANNVFMPIYGLSFNLAQLIVLAYGMYLIGAGQLTVGAAHRVPAVREQLLHSAPPARRRLDGVSAGAGGPRSHFGGAGARVEPASGARIRPVPARTPSSSSSTWPSAIPADRRC